MALLAARSPSSASRAFEVGDAPRGEGELADTFSVATPPAPMAMGEGAPLGRRMVSRRGSAEGKSALSAGWLALAGAASPAAPRNFWRPRPVLG